MNTFIKKGKKYYCPYDCGDSRYPKPSWKTEKGAQKHVDNCSMSPEKIKEREVKEVERLERALKKDNDQKILDAEKLKAAKYSVGDLINFVAVVEVKPTHEWRGERLVKVRYEPENNYIAKRIKVEKITCVNGNISYNNICVERQIVDTFEDAELLASKHKKTHLAANKQASDYR